MPEPTTIPTEPELIEKITSMNLRPRAFQALWDEGAGLRLEIVHRTGAAHTGTQLAFLRLGSALASFGGRPPPWSDAGVATQLGEALARHYQVPFFFPSPREPEAACPNWWERDKALHCRGCDKLILPAYNPHLPKGVCSHCHTRGIARDKISRDEPSSPEGVTLLLGKGDGVRLKHASDAEEEPIARFALQGLGRRQEVRDRGEVVLEGPDLGSLEAHLREQIEALLRDFEPRPRSLPFQRSHGGCQVTYEGRELVLDLVFDATAREIRWLIWSLDIVKRASAEQLDIRLVFRMGMTVRGDQVVHVLQLHGGFTTVEQIVQGCTGVLDEEQARGAIQRLEEHGYLCCHGEEVRLTAKGRHL